MLDIFRGLKNLIKVSHIHIDSPVFRLHYSITVMILVAFSLIVTTRQYVGNPIDCVHTKDIPEDVLNTYCWIHSTYTISTSFKKKLGEEVPYPGVDMSSRGEGKDGKDRKYYGYYQWVCFCLFFQDQESASKLWCLCRKPHGNRFMVLCDTCSNWYHGSCVGITKKRAAVLASYKCCKCVQLENAVKPLQSVLESMNDTVSAKFTSIAEQIADSNKSQTVELKAAVTESLKKLYEDVNLKSSAISLQTTALTQQIQSLEHNKEVLMAKLDDNENKKAAMEKQIQVLKDDNRSLTAKLLDDRNQSIAMASRIQSLEETNRDNENKKAAMEKQIQVLKDNNRSLTAKLLDDRNQNIAMASQIQSLEETNRTLQHKLTEITKERSVGCNINSATGGSHKSTISSEGSVNSRTLTPTIGPQKHVTEEPLKTSNKKRSLALSQPMKPPKRKSLSLSQPLPISAKSSVLSQVKRKKIEDDEDGLRFKAITVKKVTKFIDDDENSD